MLASIIFKSDIFANSPCSTHHAHSLTPLTSVGHPWWLSRYTFFFPCWCWFRVVCMYVQCPDTTDQHRSWLHGLPSAVYFFYNAQASFHSTRSDHTTCPEDLREWPAIGDISSWFYHSFWGDLRTTPYKIIISAVVVILWWKMWSPYNNRLAIIMRHPWNYI